MLTAIQGTYDHGQIILDEVPSVQKRTKVIVTFLEEDIITTNENKRKRQGGSMQGEVWMAADFNEPLDDLKDYM